MLFGQIYVHFMRNQGRMQGALSLSDQLRSPRQTRVRGNGNKSHSQAVTIQQLFIIPQTMDHLGDDEYQTFLFFLPFFEGFHNYAISSLIHEIDPYLDAITIDTDVTRLDTNINDAKISFLCAELALMWQGSMPRALASTPHFLLVIFCPTSRPSCPPCPSSQPIEPLSAQVSSQATVSGVPLA